MLTTLLIVFVALYVLLASCVAEQARRHGLSPRKWFLIALAINPIVSSTLLYFSHVESAENTVPVQRGNQWGKIKNRI